MQQNLIIKYFTEMCQIPHVSGHEEKISEYVANVLKQNGCEVFVDKFHNVYAKRKGVTNNPSVCFQGHLDMVGEKSPEVKHDFLKDPIPYYYDQADGWIKTKGTTLGADNGAGVAIALAAMTDRKLQCGPLEAVFTVSEETDLLGAINLQDNVLKSKYLINLDHGDDTLITIGHGGAEDVVCSFDIQTESNSQDCLEITLAGGLGGHSSAAHKRICNTNSELGLVLKMIYEKVKFNLVSYDGGVSMNAITNKTICTISTPNKKELENELNNLFKQLKNTYKDTDPNLTLTINYVKKDKQLTKQSTETLLSVLSIANSGLNEFDFNFNVPFASTNLANVHIVNNKANISWMNRSCDKYTLNKLRYKVASIMDLIHGTYKCENYANALLPDINNPLAKLVQKIAKEKFNKDMTIGVTAGVLELGEVAKHYPDMIPVCIGPKTRNEHTPREKVNVQSMLDTYELIKEVLYAIK